MVQGVPDAVIFQTHSDLEGYLWSFPRADHASVGIATRLGAVLPQYLWQRVDQFLAEMCPKAEREKRWVGLLPMAQDPTLWDTPCAGPGWALVGDAAGHVLPLTGEGIAYALWSADLLAESLNRGEPMAYEGLWREHSGQALISAGKMLCRAGPAQGAYEMLLQFALAMAFPACPKLMGSLSRHLNSKDNAGLVNFRRNAIGCHLMDSSGWDMRFRYRILREIETKTA
jgi:flavin-dependent dehydrogenase